MALLFILDAALVLAFAAALTAVSGLPSRAARLAALFVLVWADVVFVAEALSLLTQVTPGGFLAGHALLAAAAFFIWTRAGRPRLGLLTRPHWAALAASVRSWPDLWALGLAVVIGYALLAAVNALVPPNNLDSMVYHLSRVAHWIQRRTLAPWPTNCLAQTVFPPNGEIGCLWSMVFLKRDILAGFAQWFSALGAAISVFGLARVFGSSRPQAAFASGVFLSLPMIVLQSTTTQNDLTTAGLMAAMAFLLFLGLKSGRRGALLLSGAALGLALGAKLTAFMVLPGFGLGLAFLALARPPRVFRSLFLWAGACLAGFLLLGAFNYVQSRLYYGHLLGRPGMVTYQANESEPGDWKLIRSNLARDSFSLMDFSGVPRPLAQAGVRAREKVGRAVFRAARIPTSGPKLNAKRNEFDFKTPRPVSSEAGSFFGPLGFLLWLPLVGYWTIAGVLKRDYRLVPALAFVGFMLTLGALQAWQPYRGRFYCAAVALAAPLTAGLFGRGAWRTALRALVIPVALTTLTVTILTNVQKPLLGPEAVWGKTRAERRAVLWRNSTIPYKAVDKLIPEGAEIAAVLKSTDPEYPLFGERLSRAVIRIDPRPEVINPDWFKTHDYRYVVVHALGFCRVEGLAEQEFLVLFYPPYKVIIRR